MSARSVNGGGGGDGVRGGGVLVVALKSELK